LGAAVGFLFAVPRLLSGGQEQTQTRSAEQPSTQNNTVAPPRLLRSNTNLEQISDWLTTMLVGVGLSQVGSINVGLVGFRQFIADYAKVFVDSQGVASAGNLPAVGPMILIFGLVVGFLVLYLYTRVILSGSFNRVEKDLNNLSIEKTSVSGAVGEAVVDQAKKLTSVSFDPQTSRIISRIAEANVPSVADVLDVMLTLLYQAEGYKKVIELGGQLSKSPAAKTAEYWFYLAAAFGQQYRALRIRGATEKDLLSARDNALDSARRAVQLERSFAGRLWAISDPDSADNDLSDFREDPEFRSIVRRPIK
jgi:hypothetical protein